MQNVEKLIHVKNTRRLDQHPVVTQHGHGDQLGPETAPVAVIIASARHHLDAQPVTAQVGQQHHIHIDGAVIIFQNTDLFSLIQQIRDIFSYKGGLARAQKARDQIDFYHK